MKAPPLIKGEEKQFDLLVKKKDEKNYNQGKKIFPLFINRSSFHELSRNEEEKQIQKNMNILIYPERDSLRIKTDLNRKDSTAYIKFSPIKENCTIEYKFKNKEIKNVSYQFQLFSRNTEGLLVSLLDTPVYGRKQAAFRKLDGDYEEIIICKMNYNEEYLVKHQIDFQKQKVDYSIQVQSTKEVHQLLDQHIQTGGIGANPEKSPKAKDISQIGLGSTCPGDMGDTELKYLFIYPSRDKEPNIKIEYEKLNE